MCNAIGSRRSRVDQQNRKAKTVRASGYETSADVTARVVEKVCSVSHDTLHASCAHNYHPGTFERVCSPKYDTRTRRTPSNPPGSGTSMHWLYVARIPAVAVLMIAEKVAFIAPNNPGPKREEIAKYGRVDVVTRIATWFPIFSLVRDVP